MTMAGIFAKTDIRDHDEVGYAILNGLHGLLDDAVWRIGL